MIMNADADAADVLMNIIIIIYKFLVNDRPYEWFQTIFETKIISFVVGEWTWCVYIILYFIYYVCAYINSSALYLILYPHLLIHYGVPGRTRAPWEGRHSNTQTDICWVFDHIDKEHKIRLIIIIIHHIEFYDAHGRIASFTGVEFLCCVLWSTLCVIIIWFCSCV